MPKAKISATVTPERLAAARRVTGKVNVSELLDDALEALVERELERQWLSAHPDEELPGEIEVDLAHLPWDEE